LLWLREGSVRPSLSHERNMEADTPRRSAAAPTFSVSPTFLEGRLALLVRAVFE
jgi:hypothetical protein